MRFLSNDFSQGLLDPIIYFVVNGTKTCLFNQIIRNLFVLNEYHYMIVYNDIFVELNVKKTSTRLNKDTKRRTASSRSVHAYLYIFLRALYCIMKFKLPENSILHININYKALV